MADLGKLIAEAKAYGDARAAEQQALNDAEIRELKSRLRQPVSGKSLLSVDFNTLRQGTIAIADLRILLGGSAGNSTSVQNTRVVAGSDGHGNVLEQMLPAGKVGGSSGITYYAPLAPCDEATISYDVRFVGKGFDWGWGGKLPGLGGIEPDLNVTPPTGGNPSPYGWSCRGMWMTPDAHGNISPVEWLGYLYDPTQGSSGTTYGQDCFTGKALVPDRWHRLTQHHKMNTMGKADGLHEMWLDDVLVYTDTKVVYRLHEKAKVTHLLWHQFYGGSSSKWAPASDQRIQFDNLKITSP